MYLVLQLPSGKSIALRSTSTRHARCQEYFTILLQHWYRLLLRLCHGKLLLVSCTLLREDYRGSIVNFVQSS